MSKVLYVEDHPAQRDILAQMLELNGFEVAVASDGLEGVEKARSWLPDLILMDLRMPKMDGFAATSTIRKLDTGLTPIAALTAHALPEFSQRCLQNGMDIVLHKPINASDLLNYLLDIANSKLPKNKTA